MGNLKKYGNSTASDINEIYLTYLLNNKKYPDEESRTLLEDRKRKVPKKIIDNQIGRAEVMYLKFLEFLNEKEYGLPLKAYWTSRPGFSFEKIIGFSVDQRLNPTDILVKLSKEKFYGISAKSKSSDSGDVPFKNPGIGTIDNYLNSNLKSISDKYVYQIIEKFKLPRKTKDRKKFLKSNIELKNIIKTEFAWPCLKEMRNKYLHIINKMDFNEVREFIASEWLNETIDIIRLPYVKITGLGEKNYKAVLYEPINNPKIKNLNKGPIIFSSIGNDSVGVKGNNMRILKMRFKFESIQLASSIKMSGDPWSGDENGTSGL